MHLSKVRASGWMSVLALIASLAGAQEAKPKPSPKGPAADAFINKAEKRLYDLSLKVARSSWVQATYITDDTEQMAAEAQDLYTEAVTQLAGEARKYERSQLPDLATRKLMLLKLALSAPAPANAREREELTRLGVWLESAFGKGKYCRPQDKGKCLAITDLERMMATSQDPNELRDLWVGWHKISPPMRARFARFVELANKGAKEMDFADTGAMWRSNYDMPPEQFAAEVERLWQQVRPLYLSLHAYVRHRLAQKYGKDVVPENGMIPAHLLGNMWAQEWGNIYPLVAPPEQDPGYDLTDLLKAKNVDELGMVRYGENFFKSLGYDSLPQTFWERSLFKKPEDRDVVCHASAWDLDGQKDVRLKMCIQVRGEDFITIHHELGHNYYQMAYRNQPYLFQSGANDGFHEAIGDAIALSVTPEYLQKVGLLDHQPPANSDLGFLMKQALDKVAFLPFGLLIDQWRWKVFSGEIKPADYNKTWWEMRNKYQGVSAPVERTEADFDPGAKYHVPANVPYTRYFLARVLQFQFHRAMCQAAGYTGPLHRCSVYNNKAAGAKLMKMLQMGQSRPWPEALEALTGERQMDATAMLDYFAPLKKWLDEENKKNGVKEGWE